MRSTWDVMRKRGFRVMRVQRHVVVVGGGIAGLAAAFFLRGAPVKVTVLEGSARLGGKLAVSEIAGVAVDEGPRRCSSPGRKAPH
jgi:protoporphyrinogen oxidase